MGFGKIASAGVVVAGVLGFVSFGASVEKHRRIGVIKDTVVNNGECHFSIRNLSDSISTLSANIIDGELKFFKNSIDKAGKKIASEISDEGYQKTTQYAFSIVENGRCVETESLTK